MPKVSVIVPVWNRAGELPLCLAHLEQQSYPRDAYEIIVVDNGSTDGIHEVRRQYPKVTWCVEPGASSYAARNRGLSHAQGEIVAFTDADCLPTHTWLENAVTSLHALDATIVGGEIKYVTPTDRELNACELLEEKIFGMGNHQRLIEVRGFAVTANLVAHRFIFDRIGPFDSELKSSGDREWTERAIRAGASLRYAGTAIVYHPRRGSLGALCKKQRRIVGGRLILMRKQKTPLGDALSQLRSQTIFDSEMYRMALTHPQATGFKRIRLLAATVAIMTATTFERVRLLLGGEPLRN